MYPHELGGLSLLQGAGLHGGERLWIQLRHLGDEGEWHRDGNQ